MSGYNGDIRLGQTIDIKFSTVNSSGVPTTLAGTPVVSAYVDNSATEITAGITLTVDIDGRTGYHNVRVVATTGNGFATASNVSLALTAGTVGGTSVVGYEVGSFSIEHRSPLISTTAANKTLDVTSTGEVGLDYTNVLRGTNGKNIDAGVMWFGTFGTVGTNTIVITGLDASADGNINGATVWITSSTNGKESRNVVSGWNNTTKVATLRDNWTQQPSGTVIGAVFATASSNVDTIATGVTAILSAFEDDGPVKRLTTNALEQSPSAVDGRIGGGTASAGTQTSLICAALTQGDDFWKDAEIIMLTGNNTGQFGTITGFTAASDTLQWDKTFPFSVANTDQFKLMPNSTVRLIAGTHTGARIPNVTLADTVTTVTNEVTANVSKINGVTVLGAGVIGNKWRGS